MILAIKIMGFILLTLMFIVTSALITYGILVVVGELIDEWRDIKR